LDVNPFFSPDGRQIAFHSDRDGRKEVWVMAADGSNARQLSRVGATDHFLRWSDDGAWIHFRSTTLAQNGVCRAPVAGGETEPLGVPVGWHMSFSPDRSRILDAVGHKALWVYTLDGAEPRRVFGFDELDARIDYPDWSPDGRHVVFDRVVPRGGDVWQLEGLGR
jgi:TolB protein